MPQRASLRLQGIASDGTMVAEELRGGQIVLSSATGGSSGQPGRAPVPREPDQPRAMPTGTLHRAGSNVKHIAAVQSIRAGSLEKASRYSDFCVRMRHRKVQVDNVDDVH